jgi:hypothetical protein
MGLLSRSAGSQTGSQRVTLAPMADAAVKRRGHGEDAIYFAAEKNRYIGAVSLGFGPDGKRLRRKVSGKTNLSAGDRAGRAPYQLHDGVLWPVLASFTVFVLALPILMQPPDT